MTPAFDPCDDAGFVDLDEGVTLAAETIKLAAPEHRRCAGCGRAFRPRRSSHDYCAGCIGDALRSCMECGGQTTSASGRCGDCQVRESAARLRRLMDRDER